MVQSGMHEADGGIKMSTTINLTESNTLTALRSFLVSILPTGIEVARAQTNRVAEPAGADFIIMTPLMRERLETNITTYSDAFPLVGQTRRDMEPTKVTVQLDVHGPSAADNVQIITTLFRSSFATEQFALSGFDVTPLYCGEPLQAPFLNAEQQIETRWSVDAVMQANPIITNAQDFAGALAVGVINVDAAYAP